MLTTLQFNNGVPLFKIQGKETLPLIFFFNTEVPTGWGFLEPQVKLAASAGVHIHSFPLPWPWAGDPEAPDFSEGEEYMDRFIAADPDALFIPRLRCEGSDAWMEANPGERIQYASGEQPMMTSMASDSWYAMLLDGLRRTIEHYESSPYADRIVAYHPSGQNTGEWFHYEYWLKGADYGKVNQEGFRRWLSSRYGSEAALASAWNQPGMTWADARIPHAPSAPGEAPGQPFEVFLDRTAHQDRIDFHAYTSHIMADRLMGIARCVKDACARRKMVVLFYGYCFEMHGGECGHFAMEPVLSCPDVDILASPLAYTDRELGKPGSFMTAVDSLPLHNKLWVVENDYRTHALSVDNLPDFITEEGLGKRAQTPEETEAVVRREFGGMAVHRCGTWWMDLISGGAFNDPAIWSDIEHNLAPLCVETCNDPKPYAPEVAVIVDEESMYPLASPPGNGMACYSPVNDYLMRQMRTVFGQSGVPCGFYYLRDYLDGKVPAAPVVWFLNQFRATPEIVTQLHAILARQGSQAVWQYAPGWASACDGAAPSDLTGLDLASVPGPMGSRGEGPLAGLSWGEGPLLEPRLAVTDDRVEVLGRYAGGQVSTARLASREHATCFVGDVAPDYAAVGQLLEYLGVHRWVADGGCVQCDGQVLFVHYGEAGEHVIHLPAGTKAVELGAGSHEEGPIRAIFTAGQTRIWRLRRD